MRFHEQVLLMTGDFADIEGFTNQGGPAERMIGQSSAQLLSGPEEQDVTGISPWLVSLIRLIVFKAQ